MGWLFGVGWGETVLSDVFQTLPGYNLGLGQQIHPGFEDFDLVSRSQFCPKYRLNISAVLLSAV